MKEIIKRFSSESPAFFKKLTALLLSIGAAGAAIIAIPATVPQIILPPTIITMAYHMVAIGVVGSAISKLTVKDTSILTEDKSGDVTPPKTPK